jgi:4-hydroxy-3-methylbut-2-enyl diphosphate reductase
VFDATCPLVTKVHMEVHRASRKGSEAVLIGHAGHPEVIGTMGQYENREGGMYLVETPEDVAKLKVKNPDDLCFVTQTTLSVDETSDVIDALRAHFPKIQGPRKDDICYATQNRQDAVREMAGWWTPCWWWDRATLPTPTDCGSWPRRWAPRPTSSTMPP